MVSDMRIEPFTIDHYRQMTDDLSGLTAACLNQISGPAFTLSDGGQILAIGGIRVQGIGQAWALLGPGAEKRAKTVLRAAREAISHSMTTERLYRVYAEASVDRPAWFKHLGFVQQQNLYVR
jgi:hypothetical protein